MVTLLALAVTAAGCGSHGQAGRPRPVVQIVVPGYVEPSAVAYWHTVIGSVPTVRDVILNPSNGPGPVAHTDYRTLVTQLRERGIRVLGYIATGQGDRSRSAVEADVTRWRSFYGVNSVFFDEASEKAADLGLYRDYADRVHGDGGIAVLNPGVVPAQGYFAFADAVVTFEDSATRYMRAPRNPAWLSTEPREKVWNILIGVPRDRLTQVLDRVTTQNAGEVYITDDDVPNPYDQLPSFWTQEVASLSG